MERDQVQDTDAQDSQAWHTDAKDNQAQDSYPDRWQIEAFGNLRLFRNEKEVHFKFPTRKTAALLVYLALSNSTSHSYQRLIAEFWPKTEGLSSLHNALTCLRKLLEPPGTRRGSILVSDPAVRLMPTVTTDAAQFEVARRVAQGATEPLEKIAALSHAAQLYQGEILLGYSSVWFNVQRDYYLRIFLGSLRHLVSLLEAEGRFEEALRYSQRAITLSPHSEDSRDDLIRVLLRSGQTDEARRQCRALLSYLRQNRLEPTPVTRDLALQLLYRGGTAPELPSLELPLLSLLDSSATEDSKATGTLPIAHPAETASVDMAVADPASADADSSDQPDLPVYLTPFFGREVLLEEITLRLLAPSPKWVTLTGLGGVGKTRLALEAAARMPPPYADSCIFVSLTNLQTADQIAPAIAHALHLPPTDDSTSIHIASISNASVESASVLESVSLDAVVASLRQKPALLILDNMEHLAASGGTIVAALLERAPGLAVLATSRVALGHEYKNEQEQVVLVEPLHTPALSDAPDKFHASASVKLFLDRARRAKPGFQITVSNMQAIADLCRSLDGIPLAIELAAARTSSLEPVQMLARLSRRFDFLVSDLAADPTNALTRAETRHHTLWNALEWSYRLLPPGLQRFFCALSVFWGGWSTDHAKAIAAEPLAEEYLQELRKQSLVIKMPGPRKRFQLLETLREFGEAQLSVPERAALSTMHLTYFLAWSSQARKGLTGPGQSRWLERLDQEHDNLRAALRWCATQEEAVKTNEEQANTSQAELGLRLSEQLWEFWNLHAHWSEGHRWLTLFLKRTQGTTSDRASAYNGAGVLAIQQGDYAAARNDLLVGLEMARSLGPKMEGDLLSSLGYLASKPNHTLDLPREARAEIILAKYRQAMRQQPELAAGAEVATFWPLLGLGKRELDLGNRSAARSFFQESLAVCEKFGDKQGMSHPLTFLAQIASAQGNFEAAHDYLARGLRLRQELRDVAGIAVCLEQLGHLAHAQEHWAACVRLYGAAWAVRVLSHALVSENLREYQHQTDPAQARLGAAAFLSHWQAGSSVTRDQALILTPEVSGL